MRVAHVCPVFSATSETFIHDYVKETHRAGATGFVVTFARENAGSRPFANVLVARQHQNLIDRTIAMRSKWHAQSRARARGVAAAVRTINPSVVHAHFGPTGVMAAMSLPPDVPLCVSYHGYDLSILVRDEQWLQRYRSLFQRAQAFTVVSNVQKQRMKELGCPPEKVHLVRVGKVMGDYRFEPRRPPVKNFITVGRLIEKKGHADAIRAVAKLRRAGADVRLEILGGGRLEGELREVIRAEGVADAVMLLGEVPHSEVKERLANADAFLLCSRVGPDGDEEGVPTVLMEAQAMGLPCVSTRHAGIPEVIPREQHDLLAAEGDVDGIAESIKRLMDADATKVSEIVNRGRSKIAEEFNLHQETAKLVALYEQITR